MAKIPAGLWLRRTKELLRARWPLATGMGALSFFLNLGGLNSCIGLFVMPHIAAGWAAAAYSLSGAAPSLESMFKPFQKFGPVMVTGFLYAGLILVSGAAAMIVFGILFVIAAVWSAVLGDWLQNHMNAMNSEDLGLLIMALFSILWLLMLNYPLARAQLTFLFVVEKDLSPGDAFRESWRLTSPYAMRLAFIRLCAHTLITVGILLCVLPGLMLLPLALSLRGVIARSLLGDMPGANPAATEALDRPV